MSTTASFDLAHGAHLSGSTTAVVVRWVRGQLGDDGVTRMLAVAGDTRPVELLEDVEVWSSYRQATALLEAAVEVTGRGDAARRIGEETLSQHRGTAVVDLLRSLGSPEALLTSVAESAAKFSTVFSMAPQEVGPGHAVVVGVTPDGVPRHRLLCDQATGLLSSVPTVFDLAPAVVTQSECQARGGQRCVYHLRWDPDRVPGQSEADQRLHQLENRLDDVQAQLSALQSTSAEIVAATDVDTALETITRRAGAAVRATRYLLAVRMPSSDRLRLHSSGLSQDEARALAPELSAGESGPSRLVVDVASTTRRYGVLAAMLPDGSSFFPQERDLLAAYAGYAAGVLDTAWAIEDAEQQNETARALLELSRALAEMAAPADLAQRLAAAVPQLVDCDRASVLLWNDDDQLLRLAGAVNVPADAAAVLRNGIGLPDTPALSAMLTDRRPLFLQPSETDAYLRELLRRSGSDAAVVVPIVGGGRFLGVVTAGVTGSTARLERNRDLLERLEGIAHQAASALTNARLVDELQRQAVHDALTGLPNRVLLADRIEHALAGNRRDGNDCALLFLDLDRFKQVNDTLGHLAGDQLLIEVARRLTSSVRAGDTVARLGGDEFAVLLPGVSAADDAMRAAERLLDAVDEPFRFAAHEFFMTVSIGISLSRKGATTGTDLLRDADHAMYSAKAAGGGIAHVSAAEPTSAAHSALYLQADLHTALDRGDLQVVYQPLVDLATGVVSGAEALVRWTHPELGPVPPAEFLPLAEDTELGVDIDLMVLDRACAQLRLWLAAVPDLRMAVNVSRRTLTSRRLVTAVQGQLADGVLCGRLELEVTERLLDADPDRLVGWLQPLRAAGATVAVDDFGTGSSGFARLRGVHVDTLKIDRSFLAEITTADAPAPVLEAMLGMGTALQLRVVAEGVEREVERQWLLRAGCRVAQGFLLGCPADATAVSRVLPGPRRSVDDVATPVAG